jgi:hypothetical protein
MSKDGVTARVERAFHHTHARGKLELPAESERAVRTGLRVARDDDEAPARRIRRVCP